MLKKRIIPCLDIKDGRTVKGIRFQALRDQGDPVTLAARYAEQGADELVLLDITATLEGRTAFLGVVEAVGSAVNIPFTVGGGISDPTHVERLLAAGADKVSINSAAVRRPELISDLAQRFGSQCVVAAIDARWHPEEREHRVYVAGGTKVTDLEASTWARQCVERGAGEILLTSMDADGMRQGFDLRLTESVSGAVYVPVIASGGGGTVEHFGAVLNHTGASAALAAGIFHENILPLPTLKTGLRAKNIPIR